MSPIQFSEAEMQFILQASHEYVKQQGLVGNAAAVGLCVVTKIRDAIGQGAEDADAPSDAVDSVP